MPATSNVAATFRALLNVGTDDSGSEAGLATATLARTPLRIVKENAGFPKTDATPQRW